MIQFLTFNDVHISPINPESRKGDYKRDILEKLDQIKRVGNHLKVDFYVFAGDLFNLKPPIRNTHELTGTLIDLFKSFSAPVYTTEGNHDLRNDNYETLDEQPLRVMYSSGALVQLRDTLIEKEGLKVRLRAFPFTEEPDISEMPKVDPSKQDISVCVLHLYASPEGGALYKHRLYAYDELGVLGDDIFVLGHYHINQGITKIEKSGHQQYFINLGAIARGVLVEDSITRIPRIGHVTLEKIDHKSIRVNTRAINLKVKPAEEVFDLEKKKQEQKELQEAEAFVEKLKVDGSEISDNKEDLEKAIEALNLEQKVLDKIKHFLVEADLKIKELVS